MRSRRRLGYSLKLARLVPVAAVLLLVWRSEAAPIEYKPFQSMPPPVVCPIIMYFGSYGGGIDRATKKAVIDYIEASSTIARAVGQPWGLEGEFQLCVFPKLEDSDAEFQALRALMPKPEGKPTFPTAIRRHWVDPRCEWTLC